MRKGKYNVKEIEIFTKKYMELPAEAFEKHSIASKAALVVLMYICNFKIEVVDIPRISEMTGYSQEDVTDAIAFWMNLGIIQDKKKTLTDMINDKLKLVLGRPPENYEVNFIKDSYEKTGLNDDRVLAGALDLCYERNRKDLNWVAQILSKCAQAPSPLKRLELFVRYYSLTEHIKEGFGLDHELTSKEKKLILEWASKGIPLTMIYEALARCQRYLNGKISFPYINTIILQMQKEEQSDLIISDKNLGY